MKFSHFFIDRPIFAAVLSIFILIVGAIAYLSLPVAQYPEVAPPTIVVTAQYPGASADTIANTVATPIDPRPNLAQPVAQRAEGVAPNGVGLDRSATYRGAFDPNPAVDLWTDGWTAMDQGDLL